MEAHSLTFTEQPGDLSTLTDEHKECLMLIEKLCDCSTLTAVSELLFSLIDTYVFGDLEIITVDCSLASGLVVHAFMAY